MTVLDFSKKAVELAMKLGADEVDSYSSLSKSFSLQGTEESSGFSDRSARTEISRGLGVRVVVGKSVSYSYTTSLDENSIEKVVRRAIDLARAKERDPEFRGLPEPKGITKVEGIFDERIEDPPLEEGIQLIDGVLAESMEKGLKSSNSFLSFGLKEVGISSSSGIDVEFKESFVQQGVYLLSEKGGVTSLGSSFLEGREVRLKLEECMEEALEYSEAGLKVEKINGGDWTIVFHPDALAPLMEYGFSQAIDSYNVQEGKSYLSGKIGERVASEDLEITDMGDMSSGLRTRPVDGEGVPTRSTEIIKDGVLSNYLYDSYTSAKENKESTGNATRDFRSPVKVAPTNLVLRGEESKSPLEEIERGLLVKGVMGAHSTNIATGAFSVSANPAYLIENGEIKGQVRGCMIAGTFEELLRKYSFQGGEVIQRGFLVAPLVVFEGVKVSV